jgi:hypothetical protein
MKVLEFLETFSKENNFLNVVPILYNFNVNVNGINQFGVFEASRLDNLLLVEYSGHVPDYAKNIFTVKNNEIIQEKKQDIIKVSNNILEPIKFFKLLTM